MIPPEWKKLGQLLIAQRARKNAAYKHRSRWVEYTTPLGLSSSLVRDLERGLRTNYEHSTLARVETVYGLPPGWIERTLEELRQERVPDEPPAPDPRPLVDPTAAVPDRGELVLHIVGMSPLEPYERISGYAQGDRISYDFATQVSHADGSADPIQVRLTYPASDSLESVLARLRKTAKDLSAG